MRVGCCRNHEIHGASARLCPARSDGGRQASPLAGDGGVERERLESRLNDAETLRSSCTLVLVSCDKDAEMQLGQRCRADRAFEVVRSVLGDQHGRIEQRLHRQANGSTNSPGSRSRSRASVVGAGVVQIARSRGPLTHCCGAAGPRCAAGRPETVIVNSSPASARRRTSLMLLRSSFCGIVGIDAG
jgi:hypothetical protein